jgi:hypothetical protein
MAILMKWKDIPAALTIWPSESALGAVRAAVVCVCESEAEERENVI